MVESHAELIMEITKEIGLDCMADDAKNEDEDEDGNDGVDAATAPVVMAPPVAPVPPVAITLEEVVEEEDHVELVPEQEAPMAHEVILPDAEPMLPQPRPYHTLMRDYEDSPSRMMHNMDDLDDPTEASSDMDEWFPEDGSNDRD
jgi:hypothetical protein